MTGVAIEQMLELWCVELRQVKADLQSLFAHPSVATSAAAFLDGVLGPERRKTGWMRAEAAGDPGPWRQQAVLGRSHWDADALRDMVSEYALETLASPGAVLVMDETGLLKQGQNSCGVGRQYTDRRARLPAARSACLPLSVGQGLRLHRPQLYTKDWTKKPERRAAAQVPKRSVCHRLADRCGDDRTGSGGGRTVEWVATDTIYGCYGRCSCAELARVKCWAFKPQTASTPGTRTRKWLVRPRRCTGACRDVEASVGRDGTKGPRLYDWAYVELADLEAEE